MEIHFSDSAIADLQDMMAFYTDQGLAHIGRDFAKSIVEHVEILTEYPNLGRIVPEFNLDHIREIIHPPFRVVYQREQQLIDIIRVWRSERLLVLPTQND